MTPAEHRRLANVYTVTGDILVVKDVLTQVDATFVHALATLAQTHLLLAQDEDARS